VLLVTLPVLPEKNSSKFVDHVLIYPADRQSNKGKIITPLAAVITVGAVRLYSALIIIIVIIIIMKFLLRVLQERLSALSLAVVFTCKIQHFVPLATTAADKIMHLEQFCYRVSEG